MSCGWHARPAPVIFTPQVSPASTAVRRFLVFLRDSLDRRLHPRRRRRARRRLQAIAPRSALFVCLGNICRSPYGERVLSERGRTLLEVDSAGFIGPGRPPPEQAITAARACGIEHGDHRSKILTSALLEAADVIFVFDRHNVRRLLKAPGARADRVYWLG